MNIYTIDPKGEQPTIENLRKKARSRIREGSGCVMYVLDNDGQTLYEAYGEEAAESLNNVFVNYYLLKTKAVKRITRAPWYEIGGSIITVTMSDRGDYIYFKS